MKKLLLLFICLSVISLENAQAQKKKGKKSKAVAAPTAKSKDKDAIKSYADVITKEAITDDGLFKTHQVKKEYFYEIPFNVLNKDMLWVSRIAQIPEGLGGGYMNAGSKTNEQVVHWLRFQDKILLKIKSFSNIAPDTKAIAKSVQVNNYEPTLYAFNIEAFNASTCRSSWV